MSFFKIDFGGENLFTPTNITIWSAAVHTSKWKFSPTKFTIQCCSCPC